MADATRKQLLDHLLSDGLVTNEDFEKAIAKFLEYLEKTHATNKGEIGKLGAAVADALTIFKEESERDRESFKGDLSLNDQMRASKAEIRLNEAIARLDDRISAIKDGKDADENSIVERIAERLPKMEQLEKNLPVLGTAIRDALELLIGEERLKIEAIDGLREELDELKKQGKVGGGGSSQMAVAHWPIHETFTMNGSDTTVTLQQGIAAQGTAIYGARYNGQVLDLTTHYTVNGNKITFVGFTPEADTIFSITYQP